MKRVGLILLFGVAFCLVNAQPAHAIKDFNDGFIAKYVEGKGNAAFEEAVAEVKCNLCHYGKSKKNRNDFGMALSKHVDKKEVTDTKKQNPAAAEKMISDALDKACQEKKEGNGTFAELISAGKLPGTAPPDADD